MKNRIIDIKGAKVRLAQCGPERPEEGEVA